ncbi:hypothetical protein TTHERM_00320530 (macronuclear) [Tetrahymena thermophila SB210]|uniref:Uncharacterized protein n=1 Tax=Tetrahymena thermophila (strain SB210) TaxID=312017 RepID=Q237N4_TETTS|nr:hypothetical protein TTHERM_00320530 [Tetrahymena thermophila SB210]EAR92707.1 hypothetical protein TTHERM_00320530 [Tetrahymena thermophila SB210]|eukprot:XP_001012952.1 hypothetical protein TTHERM_00320530 [Tetrahymena thermophila SB210]
MIAQVFEKNSFFIENCSFYLEDCENVHSEKKRQQYNQVDRNLLIKNNVGN